MNFKQIGILSGMTYRVNVRNKIFVVLFLFTIFVAGGAYFFPSLVPGVDERALVDMSFAMIELLGFFVVLFSMSVIFYREIEGKTLLLELIKPITRNEYLLGKFFGTVLTLAWTIFFMLSIFFLFMLLDQVAFYPYYAAIAVFIFLEMVLMTGVALFFAIYTTTLPASVLFTSSVFLLGHGSAYIKAFAEQSKLPVTKYLLKTFYYALPSLDYFNLKDKMGVNNFFVSNSYLLEVLTYGILYSVIMLLLSALSFRKRDL